MKLLLREHRTIANSFHAACAKLFPGIYAGAGQACLANIVKCVKTDMCTLTHLSADACTLRAAVRRAKD